MTSWSESTLSNARQPIGSKPHQYLISSESRLGLLTDELPPLVTHQRLLKHYPHGEAFETSSVERSGRLLRGR